MLKALWRDRVHTVESARMYAMEKNIKFFWGLWAVYFLCGMHFFMHNPGGVALYLPFNAWGWIFASMMIGAGLWQITLHQSVVVSRLLLWLSLGAGLLFVPMVYPGFEFTDHAIPRLLGLAAGVLFLFCLYQWRFDHEQRIRLLYWVLGAVIIEALLGLIQVYLLEPGNWMGYSTQVNRPYGIFQQPNVMASFLATGLAIALWLCAIDLRKERWLSLLRYGVTFSACLLLAVLQSRVGIAGAVLALVLIGPLVRGVSTARFKLIWVWVLWGILAGLASLYLRSEGYERGIEIVQAGTRYEFWPYVIRLILESPWLGHGYGSFETIFLNRYATDKFLDPAMPAIKSDLDHPHNEFLYWGMEGGIVPMVGMLLMVAAFLWRISKVSRPLRLALFGLAAPILLHTQTEYPFYHAIAHWWILLLLMYVIDVEVEQNVQPDAATVCVAEYPLRPRFFLRFLALGIPLLVVPFMLTALHTAWVVVRYERGGYRDPTILLGIVNPLPWLSRVEFDSNNVRLAAGLRTKDAAHLEAYLTWGRGFVRHTPRAAVYVNMILALKALGKNSEADTLQEHAMRLYPNLAWNSLTAASAAVSLESFGDAE